MSTQITIEHARLTFHSLYNKTQFDDKETPNYNATFLLDPVEHKKTIDTLEETISDLVKEHNINVKSRNYCHPLRDGNDKSEYSGYADMVYFKAKSFQKPKLVDQDPKIELTELDDKFYSGCYVNVRINVQAYALPNTKDKVGIKFVLLAVQFNEDGENLGGASCNPETVFTNIKSSNKVAV